MPVLYPSDISLLKGGGELEFAYRFVDLMERKQIECDMIMYIALVTPERKLVFCELWV